MRNSFLLDAKGVTDAGIARLKGLALEELNLSGTKITDASLLHLEALPALRFVDVGSTDVTAKAVQALRNRVPRLTVERF